MFQYCKQDFFKRRASEVAPDLLGAILVHKTSKGISRSIITEVEAYEGPEDLASHARAGNTKRTAVMFGAPGVWYVYLIYGMYEMLNITTNPPYEAGAVLIRSVENCSGPGRLTRALQISRAYNGLAATKKNGLWIEKDFDKKVEYTSTPRIGVSYAKEWAHTPWRFVIKKAHSE
jgi:DNA-3-methyladenine glycosylase